MGGPRRRLLALSKQTPFDQRKEPPNRDAVPFYVTRNFHVFLTFFGGGGRVVVSGVGSWMGRWMPLGGC